MTSFSRILGQSWKVKFHKVKLLKFKTLNFDLKFCWNWSFFHYEKIMRFKKSPQLPGAGRTWAGHHHGSHTPTSPGAILLSKMACQPKHFGRQCTNVEISPKLVWIGKLVQIGLTLYFLYFSGQNGRGCQRGRGQSWGQKSRGHCWGCWRNNRRKRSWKRC